MKVVIVLFALGTAAQAQTERFPFITEEQQRQQKFRELAQKIEKEQHFQKLKESLAPKPGWTPTFDPDIWKTTFTSSPDTPKPAETSKAGTGQTWTGISNTPRKCAETFGMPTAVNEKDGTITYNREGKRIIAHFENGRCDYLLVTKLPNPISGIVATITDEEQKLIRKENAVGHEWLEEKQLIGDAWIWLTSDSAIGSYYDVENGACGVFTFDAYVAYSTKAFIDKKYPNKTP